MYKIYDAYSLSTKPFHGKRAIGFIKDLHCAAGWQLITLMCDTIKAFITRRKAGGNVIQFYFDVRAMTGNVHHNKHTFLKDLPGYTTTLTNQSQSAVKQDTSTEGNLSCGLHISPVNAPR